jgi:hypothetical protein
VAETSAIGGSRNENTRYALLVHTPASTPLRPVESMREGGFNELSIHIRRAQKMDFTNYEQLLKQRTANQKKGINSYMHEIALEVSEYVGEPKKFAMWLGIVKRVGPGKMTALLKQMREKGTEAPNI